MAKKQKCVRTYSHKYGNSHVEDLNKLLSNGWVVKRSIAFRGMEGMTLYIEYIIEKDE